MNMAGVLLWVRLLDLSAYHKIVNCGSQPGIGWPQTVRFDQFFCRLLYWRGLKPYFSWVIGQTVASKFDIKVREALHAVDRAKASETVWFH
jgi:hypothetical protein